MFNQLHTQQSTMSTVDHISFFKTHRKSTREVLPGHFSQGKVRNPIIILENQTYLMYCERHSICLLCRKSYDKITQAEKKLNNGKKFTFYVLQNGYVGTKVSRVADKRSKFLYIHQIITGLYGQGKGSAGYSIDHIDRNPLNNQYNNLRIATRQQQQQNSIGSIPGTKRKRKVNAQKLPLGITQEMMPKYVTYNTECYNAEKQLCREFFRIEKHPKLKVSCLSSSKSSKRSILEKLEEIKMKLHRLDNDEVPKPRKIPLYYSIQTFRNSPHLVYDRRIPNGTRRTLRMKMKKGHCLMDEVQRLREKVTAKYER